MELRCRMSKSELTNVWRRREGGLSRQKRAYVWTSCGGKEPGRWEDWERPGCLYCTEWGDGRGGGWTCLSRHGLDRAAPRRPWQSSGEAQEWLTPEAGEVGGDRGEGSAEKTVLCSRLCLQRSCSGSVHHHCWVFSWPLFFSWVLTHEDDQSSKDSGCL